MCVTYIYGMRKKNRVPNTFNFNLWNSIWNVNDTYYFFTIICFFIFDACLQLLLRAISRTRAMDISERIVRPYTVRKRKLIIWFYCSFHCIPLGRFYLRKNGSTAQGPVHENWGFILNSEMKTKFLFVTSILRWKQPPNITFAPGRSSQIYTLFEKSPAML